MHALIEARISMLGLFKKKVHVHRGQVRKDAEWLSVRAICWDGFLD